MNIANIYGKLCLGLSYRDHNIPALGTLHWPPICERIRFKLASHVQSM